jgi:hypothetical protein
MNNVRIAAAALVGALALATGTLAKAADVVTTPEAKTRVTLLNSRDMMIQADSESASVELHFAGADRIDYGLAGELSIIKNNGNIVRYRPNAYQVINGKVHPVTVQYKMEGKDRVKVSLRKFDKSAPVILQRGATVL